MSHNVKAKEMWEKGLPLINELNNKGAQQFFQSLPNYDKLLTLEDKCVRCMDEGTTGGVHMAGSGILLELDEAATALKLAGVEGIYTHEDCSASRIYSQNEGLDPAYADQYAQEWAKEICEKTGIPYKGHIAVGEMKRPGGLHIAQAIYYDATGKFNNSAPGIPAGFVISRKYLEAEYAKKELGVAISIALGDHGFGDHFTEKTPLFVIIVTEQKEEADKLRAEVASIIEDHKGRVKLDVLVA